MSQRPVIVDKSKVDFQDPLLSIWGFHVHQEFNEANTVDFGEALLLQQRCLSFLNDRGVSVDAKEVLHGGYGPHLNAMWELRVESLKPAFVLHALGEVIAFCAVNRYGRSGFYVHPTRHDEQLPPRDQLLQEGLLNQSQILWFNEKVDQSQLFFFDPPLEEDGSIVDTRSCRVISEAERASALEKVDRASWNVERPVADPHAKIIRGFHIHVDFLLEDSCEGMNMFDHLLVYLVKDHCLRPTSTRLYDERENGPHVQRGWEIKFEYRDPTYNIQALGVAIGWLICNRRGFNVFAHCVTWEEGDISEEVLAHQEYSFFLGDQVPLDLAFFQRSMKS
jgi:aromatic ring-cleaving dioxygenase